ncbi:MAG: hypothetical protein A2107_04435 [Verrucomicrobia bacterium GWF2_62_7]|nr:MAG: hypothetical protein A2107_04435 [Verrucomicrobia bacterium GWF2_62_7]
MPVNIGPQHGNFDFNSSYLRVQPVSDAAMLQDANTYLALLRGSDYQPISNYWLKPDPGQSERERKAHGLATFLQRRSGRAEIATNRGFFLAGRKLLA